MILHTTRKDTDVKIHRTLLPGVLAGLLAIALIPASAFAGGSPATVTGPLPYITWPQTLTKPAPGVYRFRVDVRWKASDPDGIASQQLAVSVDGGPFTDLAPAPAPTARNYRATQELGHRYQYRITVTDALNDVTTATGRALDTVGIDE